MARRGRKHRRRPFSTCHSRDTAPLILDRFFHGAAPLASDTQRRRAALDTRLIPVKPRPGGGLSANQPARFLTSHELILTLMSSQPPAGGTGCRGLALRLVAHAQASMLQAERLPNGGWSACGC